MNTIRLRARQIEIPMRSSFKHASAERTVSDSVWIEAERNDVFGLGEGCPRPYVTGETTAGALEWIESICSSIEGGLNSLGDLKDWTLQYREQIDKNPAAWCAVETALLDLLARERKTTVEQLLGVQALEGKFRYSAVLSDEKPEKFEKLLSQYFEMGFRDFKFKVSANFDGDKEKFELFDGIASSRGVKNEVRLRLDGNNVWADKIEDANAYLDKVKSKVKIFAVEEPLRPRDAQGLSALSTKHDVSIVLDESMCRLEDVKLYERLPGSWIANIRVSKMGGVLRSLELVERLKATGIKIIVGAQVGETSILTRAALTVAHAAGDILVAQEGAFGTLLLEHDAVKPVLMFGPGGWLQYPIAADSNSEKPLESAQWGLGLEKTI